MCLNYNFMKRLHLSHRVFWKAAQHFTGKNLSTFVPLENFFMIPKRFKSEKNKCLCKNLDTILV